ncbi:hypothetical protein Csa_007175, partial [Cucumis sativus]
RTSILEGNFGGKLSEEVKELQSLRREKIVAKTFALPNENPKVTLPLNIQINHSKINSIDNSLKEGPKAKSHMHGAQTSSNDQQQPFVPSKRLVPSPSGGMQVRDAPSGAFSDILLPRNYDPSNVHCSPSNCWTVAAFPRFLLHGRTSLSLTVECNSKSYPPAEDPEEDNKMTSPSFCILSWRIVKSFLVGGIPSLLEGANGRSRGFWKAFYRGLFERSFSYLGLRSRPAASSNLKFFQQLSSFQVANRNWSFGAHHVRILKATTFKRSAYLEGTKLFILPTACLADQGLSSYSVLSLF